MSKKAWIIIAIVVGTVLIAILWSVYRGKKHDGLEPLTIGAILPLTGSSARYGIWIKEGLDLAQYQVNSTGGVSGRPLRIIYEDDQAQPSLAISGMQKLVTVDKVPLVFGSWASSSVLAQSPIAEQSKTVLMAEAISPKIRDAGDYVFRIQPDARFYLKTLVPFLYSEQQVRTASTVYINNDFGVDQAAVFKAEFEKLGGRVLSQESYVPNATDFRAQLTKIAAEKPEVIFLPGYTEVGTIMKQARELGLISKFVGSVPTENPDLIKIAGAVSEGVIYPSHFDPDTTDPAVEVFQKLYSVKYGRPAEGLAALAYDGLNIIVVGLKQCGANSTCLKEYLYSVKNYAGVTGKTSFDEAGDVVKPIVIKTVREGRFEVYR